MGLRHPVARTQHKQPKRDKSNPKPILKAITLIQTQIVSSKCRASRIQISGLFCGKRPIMIRHPMGLCHPVARTQRKQPKRDKCNTNSIFPQQVPCIAHLNWRHSRFVLNITNMNTITLIYAAPFSRRCRAPRS